MRINKAISRALKLSRSGSYPAAWRTLFPHRGALTANPELAAAWLELTARAEVGYARRREVLDILEAWPDSPAMVSVGADTLLEAFDGRPHDVRPPPTDPMRRLSAAIESALLRLPPTDLAAPTLRHRLGCALRLAGQPGEAVEMLTSAVASSPEQHGWRYDLGLACKAAVQLPEALEHFDAYRASASSDDEGLLWNLAICATGARQGERALALWHEMGMTDATLGRDGLPRVPDLGPITVRVRQDDGHFIEVPAQPHSPCHGWLRPPVSALAVWDGAPIRPVQPGQPPCLPLLARL